MQWSSGLFSCTDDVSSCAESAFCFYCQLGHQYDVVRAGRPQMNVGVCMGACMLDLCCAFGLAGTCFNYNVRERIRTMYAIQGDSMGDCLTAWCCGPCAQCQQYRELTLRGMWPGGICVERPAGVQMQGPTPMVLQHGPPVAQYPTAYPPGYSAPQPTAVPVYGYPVGAPPSQGFAPGQQQYPSPGYAPQAYPPQGYAPQAYGSPGYPPAYSSQMYTKPPGT